MRRILISAVVVALAGIGVLTLYVRTMRAHAAPPADAAADADAAASSEWLGPVARGLARP